MNFGDLLKNIGIRLLGRAGWWLITTVLGVALTLGWWTCTGTGDDDEFHDSIPAVFFEGGDKYEIDIELTQPGEMYVSAVRDTPKEYVHIEAVETFQPGEWTLAFEAAPDTLPYLDLQIKQPTEGALVRWTVYRNGEKVWSESTNSLGETLPNGWYWGLELYPEQWAPRSEWR